MPKKITWKDIAARACVLTISDGSNTTTDLTPGETPFVTQIDDSDDLFQPIRTSTGNIQIVIDSVDDIVDLVGRTPISTPVQLKVGDTVRWVGFLGCKSFSQEWDRGPLEVSLPVMSGLEVLNGLHYPYNSMADLGFINFAQFLCNLNAALNNPYTYFYFPNISDPSTTLTYKFRMGNYATPDDKNTTYEMATYYEILEDICKLFGWQVIEYGTRLVFLAADVKSVSSGSNMKGFTAANLQSLANGQSVSVVTPSFAAEVPEFYGVDHRRSFVAGRNKVDVVGQLNEIAEDIWSMDVVEQCVYKGHDTWGQNLESYDIKKFATYQSEGASSPNGNILAYNSLASMTVDTQFGDNIKFNNYKYSGISNAYGGCIAYERFYKRGTTGEITEGDRDYMMRLIVKGNSSDLLNGIIIHTNFYFTPDQNSTNRFYVEGNVLTANAADDVFDKPTGYTYCRAFFRVGNQYFNGSTWTSTRESMIIIAKDGEIYYYGKQQGAGVSGHVYISAPSTSGEVILELVATTLDSSSYGPGNEYVAYEGLKIRMRTANNRRSGVYIEDKSIREDINENKVNLNNGFTDEWSQSCGLTLAREDVPSSYGAILKSDLTLPPTLYSRKYPEKALCDRVADYAAKARMVLYAVVKGSGQMLSPLHCYAMQTGGRPWICLCQTVNWQNNEITAGFFEPSYNT